MKHDAADIAVIEVRENLSFLERELLADLKEAFAIIKRQDPIVRKHHRNIEHSSNRFGDG